MNYWLMKSEPTTYSIDHLQAEQVTLWDGVRNYQARNFLRQMCIGDQAFFYHSNCQPPAIVGLMQVTAAQVVDPTQFDPQSDYYDPKARPEAPRWQTVQVTFLEKWPRPISLATLKTTFSPEELDVVKKGNRLSVMPVALPIAERLLALAYN
ncbi:EVE domain-containing protein [Synechocystis sp. LKSZ1]|uniref:EVE domain-containing protein n=1 Tax=Synechocystis sp. LKSZ1 TaxID=3144951 RepID=UPI00336BFE56